MKDYQLVDNEEEKQYEFHIDDYLAKIEYIKTKDDAIYLTHTEVPRALGGQGIATQLVEKVFKDIENKDLKLVPLCPFVIGYLNKNPEWGRLVKRG